MGYFLLACLTAVALGCGETTVTGNDQAQASSVMSLKVKPTTVYLNQGDTAHLTTIARNTSGDTVEGYGVAWASRDTSVATVDSTGIVTLIATDGMTEVTATTKEPDQGPALADTSEVRAVTPVFSDGFESGDFSFSQNGYSWNPSQASVETSHPTDGDVVNSGDHAAAIRFGPNADGEDGFAFIQNDFVEEDLKEIWVSYRLYIPSNYRHREQSSTQNNKFFIVWGDPRSDKDAYMSVNLLRGNSDTDSNFRIVLDKGDEDIARTQEVVSPFITSNDLGEWHEFKAHLKVASGADTEDGVYQYWWDGSLLAENFSVDFYVDPDAVAEDPKNYFEHLRIWGWANSGYTEQTDFLVDEVMIFTEDPGWN